MIPGMTVQRLDGQTGVVAPSAAGVLAIIACAVGGTVNMPTTVSDNGGAQTTFTAGPLVRYAAFTMGVAKKPVLLVAANASTAGAYGAIQQLSAGGTSVATVGGTAPVDHFNALITWVLGGTRGTAGATYTASLDGGVTTDGPFALGTATSIAINYPKTTIASGVTVNLSAGTFVPGGSIQVFTSRPQPNAADLVAAREALRTTLQPWEAVYEDIDATTTEVGALDTWLSALETDGIFNEGALSIRHKLQPVTWVPNELAYASSLSAPAESETAYAAVSAVTSMSTVASIRLIVGADAADATDQVTGLTLSVPTGLVGIAVAMGIPIGQDPAWKAAGNIPSVSIYDQNGNPKWHDERKNQTLDTLRFTTMRTWAGSQGTYLNNVKCFSPNGSDYVYIQQLRVMNAALTVAYQLYTEECGKGVGKSQPDPVTGAVYILEASAQAIESFVNQGILEALQGQVQGVNFQIKRNTDIGSNQGATLPATLSVACLAYVKNEPVTAQFVRSLPTQQAA